MVEKKKKAFFFLRHNNDIDHITPVLYKWLSNKKISTDIIITTDEKFLDDYRIKILKQFKHANIYQINNIFKKTTKAYFLNHFYKKYGTQIDNLSKKQKFIRKQVDKTIKTIAKKIFKDTKNAIVVFDWTLTYFTLEMIKEAKKRGFKTVSLPHGDAPYINHLITINDFNISDCLSIYKPSKNFDYVVVPNKLCSERYEPYIDKNRIKILGSPRYSNEWMKINNKYIPKYENKEAEGKIKIVFFLRNIGFPIFWEEIVKTIKIILQFQDIYLIVKHHPRNRQSKKLTKKLADMYPDIKEKIGSNLLFLYGKENSASLMKWSDLIIDIGTSVTWEAIREDKSVIMLDYVHANYSTVSYYMKNTEMRCRDDLYNIIEKLSKNKNQRFYTDEEKKLFIKEIIEVPDEKVLERYTDFLESLYKDNLNE